MKRLMAAVLILGGCNDGGINGSATGGLTSENSDEVGAAIAATVAGGGTAVEAGGGAQSFTECWTVSGDESDVDQDGIPADAVYTLANCTYSEAGYTSTWNGTEGIEDTNPNVADYAFSAEYDLTGVTSDGAGNSESDHYVASDVASVSGNVYSFAEVLDVDYSGVWNGQSYSGEYAHDLTWAFTPAAADWSTGTETVDGTWSATFDGESVSATIATTVPLGVDASCDTGIVSGTIVATSGGATETITWTGCNQYTIEYDG